MTPSEVNAFRPPPHFFAPITPSGTVTIELFDVGRPEPPLFPIEATSINSASAARKREFALGRSCARAALGELGEPEAVPIPVGCRREPLWPDGVVGSITHTGDYCAAAVANRSQFLAIGIDAERDRPLPSEVEEIAVVGEELSTLPDGTNWPTVVFSAKEAAFKAWTRLTGEGLDPEQIVVSIDPVEHSLAASIQTGPGGFFEIPGRFALTAGLILTTAWQESPGRSRRRA